MEIIKTPNFDLAIRTEGDPNASKLAIVVPGRLDTKDYAHNVSHVSYLASRGMYAISFDPPGTWESPGDIALYTMTNYLKVINELILHYGSRPTFLMGHSRGGSVAILAGSDHKAVVGIAAIMANYGAPTPPKSEAVEIGYQQSYRDLPPGSQKTVNQQEFKLPVNYFADGQQYDIQAALKQCRKSKLLIYSDQDDFTNPEEVENLYQSLPNPKSLQKVHAQHDYRLDSQAIEEVNRCLGSFLDSQDTL